MLWYFCTYHAFTGHEGIDKLFINIPAGLCSAKHNLQNVPLDLYEKEEKIRPSLIPHLLKHLLVKTRQRQNM